MCGICGFVNLNSHSQTDYSGILAQMCDTLKHRGPDSDGSYFDNFVALGMRRLKIIDLATGDQPIHNEDKTIWVVLNGEIYNFRELREELEKQGHIFYTQSDTEVIVHLYEQYGDNFIKHLNGMFAFALWDKVNEKLVLSRDRIGKKPLHYAILNNKLIFASEIKAILKFPGFKREIDRSSLVKYLSYEFVPAPQSIFKGIKKILPGHYLLIKDGRIQDNCYWEPQFSNKIDDVPDEKAVIYKFKELLKTAVKLRLISDVPLGVFLSGGIDSSSLVAVMSQVSGEKIKTFTIGFEDRSFDEIKYARRVARIFNTEHYERILNSKQMLDLIPKITDFLDEPLGDASIIPTYLLSQVTREKITVALGGDGGDELFAGYPTYQAHKLAAYYEKIPMPIRKGLIENIVKNLPVSFNNISIDFQLKRFISGLDYPSYLRHYIWLGSFSPYELKQILKPEFKDLISQELIFSEIIQYVNQSQLNDPIDQTQFLDLKLYLQDDILVKVDRASMACSLEVRAPFLDYNIVEFVTGLPARLKLKGLRSKYLLKKSMEGLLPKEILNRRKKGFGIPVARWISSELKDFVTDVLSPNKIKREGIFNPEQVSKLLDDHFAKIRDNRKQIWTLLMFELWLDKYLCK